MTQRATSYSGIMFGELGPIGPIMGIMPKSRKPAEGFSDRLHGLEN